MNLIRNIAPALAIAGLCLTLGSAARADISAFNDFGANWDRQTGSGWTVTGPNSFIGQQFSPGNGFISGASGQLTSIDIALEFVAGGDNSATVGLYTDNGTGAPASLLESFNLTNLPQFGDGQTPTHLTSTGGVNLVAGQEYWLQTSNGNDGWLAWDINNQGVNVDFSNNGSAVGQNPAGAFDVNVAPVPEASTAVTFALLMIGGGRFLRRRRSAKAAI